MGWSATCRQVLGKGPLYFIEFNPMECADAAQRVWAAFLARWSVIFGRVRSAPSPNLDQMRNFEPFSFLSREMSSTNTR
jgi:hypothetical protein